RFVHYEPMAVAEPARADPGTLAAAPPRRQWGPQWLHTRGIRLLLRSTLSVGLLAVLITRLPLETLTPKNSHLGTMSFLVGAIAFVLIGFGLSAWRWHLVLLAFDVHVRWRTLFKHTLAGQFVG